ncbi:autotransporter outer membrane beta-barrel domain-containing protein [Glacieibacterium megasporae]|uniref:autotransporter outer membrane beta-barrel domain-containing protein n=1 Tax=Glacieibacterium megasporae TaxID=2835787 RepID=UPI001C1E5DE5|nr:autotransporter outer membrane beta-barrel domain-containing protein [Polymorphobacter megasporae]UAJ09437.1 autotransporter domain-containing protein [Polymorphobacter megasporae]
MHRHRLFCGTAASLALATITTAARADDLSISASQTTPVATATAANNSAGNITLVTGGAIAVTSGTAATINSSNTLTNGGAISSSATTGSIGVLINSGNPIGFVNNGSVALSATGGSGNVGVSIAGPVTGTISSGTAGSVTVAGDGAIGVAVAAPFTGSIGLRSVGVTGANSTAVSVTAPLTGSLTLTGTNETSGAGGYGLLIAAPVSGTVNTGGSISAGTIRAADATTGVLVAGVQAIAAERVSASVGGGLINDRYYIDSTGATVAAAAVDTTLDTLVTGSIIATGAAPALWVAPDATNPTAITIGAAGTGTDAYAIVNRGVLQTSIANTGLAAVALRVGGGGATTTLIGGINNQSTATISSASLDASSTGVDLLAGAVVPQVVNAGVITVATSAVAASGSTPVGPGGAGYGVVAEVGSNLGAIVNSGTIIVSSVGAGNGSTAILDRSGTLTSINNSGTITATATGTNGFARAIDLTGNTAAVTVTNSGTITGDVVLGNGPTTLALTAGTINGAVSFGTSTSNLLALSGTSTLTGALTTAAPIAVTLTDTARLSLASGPTVLASLAAMGNSVLVLPIRSGGAALTVNGSASFTGTSTISVALQSLALNQNVTIIQAAGGITTDHLATLVDATSSPYLFTATAPVLTPTTLSLGLTRKTAAQAGLTGAQATLYDQSVIALASSPTEAGAIANLPDQASVLSAYRQITPPSFGRAQLRAAQSAADAGFGAAADRVALLTDFARPVRNDDSYGVKIWAQELGDFSTQAAGTNEDRFTTAGFGFAGGVDTSLLGIDAVGLAFLADYTTIHHDGVGTAPGFNVPVTTTGVEPYAAWTWRGFFVTATGLAAHVKYTSKRTLAIGSISDTVGAAWTGTQFGAGLTFGAKLNFGAFRLTPSNAIAWTSLRQGGYTESGAGNFALAVAGQRDTVTTDTAKLALAYIHAYGDGKLKVEAHGAYAHQFNASPTTTVASFVSGGGPVELVGDAARAEETSYGADLGYAQDMVALRVGYDRRSSSGGYRDQAIAVTAGIAF